MVSHCSQSSLDLFINYTGAFTIAFKFNFLYLLVSAMLNLNHTHFSVVSQKVSLSSSLVSIDFISSGKPSLITSLPQTGSGLPLTHPVVLGSVVQCAGSSREGHVLFICAT